MEEEKWWTCCISFLKLFGMKKPYLSSGEGLIVKKGDKEDPGNYRGITLSVVGSLL